MGGIAIAISILINSIFFLSLKSKHSLALIFVTIAFASLGAYDDFKKIFKKNKKGLSPKLKILIQSLIGVTVAFLSIEKNCDTDIENRILKNSYYDNEKLSWPKNIFLEKNLILKENNKNFITSIPFCKNYFLDYSKIIPNTNKSFTVLIFILIVIFILTATSNATNLIDGMDGSAAGFGTFFGFFIIFLSLVSSNFFLAKQLNLLLIPNAENLLMFSVIFTFAYLGFLWENAYPAKIFMGDTGSLLMGGLISTIMIFLKQELLIPIVGIVLVVENLSVIIQTAYFKYTKKKTGQGKRIFLCAPIHHHFQAKGEHENRISFKFFIITIISIFISITSII